MVLMLLCCAALGGFQWRLNRARRQHEVVRQLEQQGVYVEYSCERPSDHSLAAYAKYRFGWGGHWPAQGLVTRDFYETVIGVNASSRVRVGFVITGEPIPLTDPRGFWLSVSRLHDLEWLGASAGPDDAILPADLRQLRGLRNLNDLHLESPDLMDDHLVEIGRLPALQKVFVGAPHLSDRRADFTAEGIKHLRSLPRLKMLDLSSSTVDDRAATAISELRQLEYLDLTYTNVSDEGVSALVGLQNLKRLYLDNTLVTDLKAIELQGKLPGCKVMHAAFY